MTKGKAKAKVPVGRPSKYDSLMLAKAQHYLDNYKELGDVVPTVVGLALTLDVVTSTVYQWHNNGICPSFSSIFTRIEQLQHQGLINGGLSGGFNPAITKMLLTKHGYSDKVEADHSSSDGSMTQKATVIQVVGVSSKAELDEPAD